MDRFDISGRYAALRETIGADADSIDVDQWAQRLLGDRCFRFIPGLDPARDPLSRAEDGRFILLMHRAALLDRAELREDVAFALARYWLRDLADERDFAALVHDLADLIIPPKTPRIRAFRQLGNTPELRLLSEWVAQFRVS